MKHLLKGVILILVLVLVGFVLEKSGIRYVINEAWIDEHISGNGFSGQLFFLAIGVVALSVGAPRQLISFLAGYAFGFKLGLLVALLVTSMACVIVFFCSRFIIKGYIQEKFSEKVRKADSFFRENTFSTTLLVRLLPVGNNVLTSLVAGASSAKAWGFLLGSTLGYIPQTLIFSLLGSGITIEPVIRIGVSIFLFILSGLLGIYLYQRYRYSRDLNAVTDTMC